MSKWYSQKEQHGLYLRTTAKNRRGGPDRFCEGWGRGGPQSPRLCFSASPVPHSHCRWASSATLFLWLLCDFEPVMVPTLPQPGSRNLFFKLPWKIALIYKDPSDWPA